MKTIWHKVLPVISPGIRVKLTLFTLFFVSALLLFSFLFSYFRQKAELSSAFEKEMRAPLEFVAGNVADLNRIAQGLISLESFRIHLKQKTTEAQKFKKAVLVKEDTVGNRLRSVTKFFGAKVRYTYQTRRYDTYFSTYLTAKNLQDFELQLKAFTDVTMNSSIPAAQFTQWKVLAAQVAVAELKIAQTEKPTEVMTHEVARKRARLLGELKKPFGKLFSARLERTGLAAESIRILSYDIQATELFDTAAFFPESGVSTQRLFRLPDFNRFKDDFFSNEDVLSARAEFKLSDAPFDAQFTPVFTNYPVVERAQRLAMLSEKQKKAYGPAVAIDQDFANQLRDQAAKKMERLKLLREKGIPPSKDPEFMGLAQDYRVLADKRDKALRGTLDYSAKEKRHFTKIEAEIKERENAISQAKKLIKAQEEKQKLVISGKASKDSPSRDELEASIETERQAIEAQESEKLRLKTRATSIREDEDLLAIDSILRLRDTALLAKIRLALVSEQDALNLELKSEEARRNALRLASTICQFIHEARSETDFTLARGVQSPLSGGVLAVTRSEAEEYMHLLDATPIWGDAGLAAQLVTQNVVGYNLAIINKREGLRRILISTRWLVLFSSGIAVLAIIAAWFFSGLAVKRLKSLSGSAMQVRQGNLNTVFDAHGFDELAGLGANLNDMVHGLKEREEMKGELMAAEEIQKRLLPSAVPKNLKGRADIAGFYKAMVGVGGDYFDYIALGSDHVAIAMGDVSNHGVGPALVMAITRSQLHAQLREKEISLKNIMLKLNEQLYAETPANIFVTFFLALYNLKTGELQYISAGHSRPLLWMEKANKAEYLEAGGMPLGMDDNDFFETTLEPRKIILAKGDVFFQYTDGLSEAMSPAREQFGYERMEKILAKSHAANPESILTAFATGVENFADTKLSAPGPSELSDDIALVCLKRAADI